MDMHRLRRFAANFVIVTFIVVIAIDAMPSTCTAHQRLKAFVDPALDASGLWQESWRLFAPEPDCINTRVSARVVFSDGSEFQWRSPNWSDLSSWQKFTHFRHMEYYDKLRNDDNSSAWGPFASHMARTIEADSGGTRQVAKVELTRHWLLIDAPQADGPLLPVGGSESGWDSWLFYTWTPNSGGQNND